MEREKERKRQTIYLNLSSTKFILDSIGCFAYPVKKKKQTDYYFGTKKKEENEKTNEKKSSNNNNLR